MEKQGKSYTLEMHITAQELVVSPGVQELMWYPWWRTWLKRHRVGLTILRLNHCICWLMHHFQSLGWIGNSIFHSHASKRGDWIELWQLPRLLIGKVSFLARLLRIAYNAGGPGFNPWGGRYPGEKLATHSRILIISSPFLFIYDHS